MGASSWRASSASTRASPEPSHESLRLSDNEDPAMNELLRRLRFLLQRDRFDEDLDEEIRDHLRRKAGDIGSPSDARQQFGNVTLIKEESRRMWTGNFAEQLAQDALYAVRAMSANKLFTLMAVSSLALGI